MRSEGEGKKDFLAKMSIALKEARETHYWLRLIQEELVALLSRITLTTRHNLGSHKRASSPHAKNSSFHISHSESSVEHSSSPISHFTFPISHSKTRGGCS